jgi:ABC-type Fe3+-hydroxamate transport system substrate-binding protein
MSWMQTVDDLGFKLDLAHEPRRIVSLVPSWTETLFAFGLSQEIVGITKFCVEPAAAVAEVPKIGGTKNPDIKRIHELKPDLVIANAEENRREDIEQLRAAGVQVFTTYPRTVAMAVEGILKLGNVVGRPAAAGAMARDIVKSVSEIETGLGAWSKLRFRVFCPVWKNPWIAFNGMMCCGCSASTTFTLRPASAIHASRSRRRSNCGLIMCCCRASRTNSTPRMSRS